MPAPLSRAQSLFAILRGALVGIGGAAISIALLYYLATSGIAEYAGLFILAIFTIFVGFFSWVVMKAAFQEAGERRYIRAIVVLVIFSGVFISAHASMKMWPILYSHYATEK
jgi:hypothetical protein